VKAAEWPTGTYFERGICHAPRGKLVFALWHDTFGGYESIGDWYIFLDHNTRRLRIKTRSGLEGLFVD